MINEVFSSKLLACFHVLFVVSRTYKTIELGCGMLHIELVILVFFNCRRQTDEIKLRYTVIGFLRNIAAFFVTLNVRVAGV